MLMTWPWHVACSARKCQVAHHTHTAAAKRIFTTLSLSLFLHVFLIKIENHKDQSIWNQLMCGTQEKRVQAPTGWKKKESNAHDLNILRKIWDTHKHIQTNQHTPNGNSEMKWKKKWHQKKRYKKRKCKRICRSHDARKSYKNINTAFEMGVSHQAVKKNSFFVAVRSQIIPYTHTHPKSININVKMVQNKLSKS